MSKMKIIFCQGVMKIENMKIWLLNKKNNKCDSLTVFG